MRPLAPSRNRILPGIFWACLGFWLVFSAGLAGLLAFADWRASANTPEALREVVRLTSWNAAYRLWLADLEDADGADPKPLLAEATRLNPLNASHWIQLGLRWEMEGDFVRAERFLLHAADISRQYRPRWVLANYYFRRGQADAFWRWTREALDTAYPDPMPLFRLAWALEPDPDVILRRGIPDRQAVLVLYLLFLTRENHLAEAEAVVSRATADITAGDDLLLLEVCDRFIAGKRYQPALAVWNALAARSAIPLAALQPGAGVSLTNAALDLRPLQGGFVGFNWRVEPVAGVRVAPQGRGRAHVDFSGGQPDTCEPLAQWLPLVPGRKYVLVFDMRPSDAAVAKGLAWQVQDAGGEPLLLESLAPSPAGTGDWETRQVEFSTKPGTHFARLALHYQRPVGATPAEGSITLRNLTLGFAR